MLFSGECRKHFYQLGIWTFEATDINHAGNIFSNNYDQSLVDWNTGVYVENYNENYQML